MKLILINGLPGSGKTTLMHELSKRIGVLGIARDELKEIGYDILGHKDHDVAWSKQLGLMTLLMMHKVAKNSFEAGSDLLLETNFNPNFAHQEIVDLIAGQDVDVYELFCKVDPVLAKQRFVDRLESGNRHIGHREHTLGVKDSTFVEGSNGSVPVGVGKLLEVDTSKPITELEWERIINFLDAKQR